MLTLTKRHEEEPMPGARRGGRRAADDDTALGKEANGIDTAADALPRLRPTETVGTEVARGLKGVIVAETEIGDVRGLEGFYHYRQYSAVELARTHSVEEVWRLMLDGALPDAGEA